jgi:hypothetical protein
MAGSNSSTISGLRFHINDAEDAVHVHDDSASLKFELDKSSFRKEAKDALENLRKDSGTVAIKGKTNTSLYFMNDEGSYSIFLSNGSGVKNELEKFLKGC